MLGSMNPSIRRGLWITAAMLLAPAVIVGVALSPVSDSTRVLTAVGALSVKMAAIVWYQTALPVKLNVMKRGLPGGTLHVSLVEASRKEAPGNVVRRFGPVEKEARRASAPGERSDERGHGRISGRRRAPHP